MIMKFQIILMLFLFFLTGCAPQVVRQSVTILNSQDNVPHFVIPEDLMGNGDGKVVGIVGVTNTSVFRSDTLWDVASRILTTNLMNMNFFRVRDWERTRSLYGEADLRSSNIATTPDNLRQIRSELDCDLLMGGSVTYYDITEESEISATSKNKKITTSLRVDLWLQDANTGEYVSAASGNGQSMQNYSAGLFGGQQGAWTQNAAHRALEVAMNEALIKVLRQYQSRPALGDAVVMNALGERVLPDVVRRDFSGMRDFERTSNTWALIVGVNEFSDASLAPLRYARKDALSIYEFLVSSEGADFAKDQVFVLLDQDATIFNIKAALDTIAKNANYDDKVFLYFSTHGVPGETFESEVRFMATYDTRLNSMHKTSLSFEEIDDAVNARMKPESVMVVADACFNADTFSQGNVYSIGGKGVVIQGKNDSLPENFKGHSVSLSDAGISPDIIRKFANSEGRVFMASSDWHERSWESEKRQHGFFTYYFLDAVSNHGLKSSSEIYAHLKTHVPQSVAAEIGKSQHPVLGMNIDIILEAPRVTH
jgi:curli biogenesis system outer membrane secretion channel CsgG